MSSFPVAINFDGLTKVKVINGETYTVPGTIASPSPTGRSSGVFPTDTFDAKREVGHALIYDAFSDAAGPGVLPEIGINLRPGDVVVLSAVVSTVITVSVNGVIVYSITGVTTTGGILLVVG